MAVCAAERMVGEASPSAMASFYHGAAGLLRPRRCQLDAEPLVSVRWQWARPVGTCGTLLWAFCVLLQHLVRKVSQVLLLGQLPQAAIREESAVVGKRPFLKEGEHRPLDLAHDLRLAGLGGHDVQLDVHVRL